MSRSRRRAGTHLVASLAVSLALALTTLPAGSGSVADAAPAARPGPARKGTLSLATRSIVAVGEDLVATTVSRPARPGTVVRLQLRRGDRWVTADRARQNRRGVATLEVARPEVGLLRVRAVRGKARAVSSAVALVRVAPAEETLPPVPGQQPSLPASDLDVSADSRVLVSVVRVASPDNGGSTLRVAAYDRLTRTTVLLPAPAGTIAQTLPAVSPNGRFVVFVSDIAQDRAGPRSQVQVADLTTGRVSSIAGPLTVTGLDVSSDGRWVAITGTSWSTTTAACTRDPSQGGERENDVYLLDRRTGRVACPSAGLDGRVQGRVGPPTLSLDASVLSFGFGYRDRPNGDFEGQLVRWEAGQRRSVEGPSDTVYDYTDRVAALLVDLPRPDGEPGDLGLYDVARRTTRNLTGADEHGSNEGHLAADGSSLWFTSEATDIVDRRPEPIGGNPGCVYRRQVTTGAARVAFCGTERNEVAASADGRFYASTDGTHRIVTRFYPR